MVNLWLPPLPGKVASGAHAEVLSVRMDISAACQDSE